MGKVTTLGKVTGETVGKASRKVIAYVVGMALTVGLYILTLCMVTDDTALVPIFVTTISAVVLLTFALIGGRLWKDFIRSKYFKSGLVGK